MPKQVNLVGKRVIQARSRCRPPMTQLALSQAVSSLGARIDRAGIAKIETGIRLVRDFEVVALSKALDVTVGWLLGEKPVRKKARSLPRSSKSSAAPKRDTGRQSLSKLMTGILKDKGKPMSAQDILKVVNKAGYKWRTKDPLGSLILKLTADRTFRRVSPGVYAVRESQ